jgi:hypothetical protein
MLSVIVEGITFKLDDGVYCWYLGDDGLGMAPQHRFSSRGTMQDGDTDRGERLDPRIFRLILEVDGTSLPDLFVHRNKLLAIFKASANPLIFECAFEDEGKPIYLKAFIVDDMTFPSSDREGYTQKLVATFKANDPTFYDMSAGVISFLIAGGSGSGAIPMAVPTAIGASTINQMQSLDYQGTWRSCPTLIRVTGPITDAVFTNETTGEKLDFMGKTIAAGHYYDIDCRWGYKTVKDETGANKIADLTNDSDLATWHLREVMPGTGFFEEPGMYGINSIRVTGSGCTAATRVDITFLTRYLGI